MQQRLGSIIGAIGGLVFILVNAGQLPSGLAGPVRIFGVVAFVVVLWWAVVRRRTAAPLPAPGPTAGRTYGFAVLGMVVAILVGANLLNRVLDRPDLVLPWVVFAVGAHFLPFARAFELPLFARLSVVLMVVALLGGAAVLLAVPSAAAWTAVAAGVVLFAFSAAGASRGPGGSD